MKKRKAKTLGDALHKYCDAKSVLFTDGWGDNKELFDRTLESSFIRVCKLQWVTKPVSITNRPGLRPVKHYCHQTLNQCEEELDFNLHKGQKPAYL